MRLFLASAICAATIPFISIAEACTCPPYPDAAAHADQFDFVALGHVEEVYTLQDPELAARFAYELAYNEALTLYMLDVEAGDDTRTLREFEEDYQAENPPRPFQFMGSGYSTLTRITISNVLKGEDTSQIYVHSAPPGSPSCGMNYRPDTDMVVLTGYRNGKHGAWMCSIPMFSKEAYEAALSEAEAAPSEEETTPSEE